MSTNNSVMQPQIRVFPERNYVTLFIKMRTILRPQDFWEFVTIDYLERADQALELSLTNTEHALLKENQKKDH